MTTNEIKLLTTTDKQNGHRTSEHDSGEKQNEKEIIYSIHYFTEISFAIDEGLVQSVLQPKDKLFFQFVFIFALL